MSEYYTGVPIAPPTGEGRPQTIVLEGEGWYVFLHEGRYILDYISGDAMGSGISVEITGDDYRDLHDGTLSLDDLIIKYEEMEKFGR